MVTTVIPVNLTALYDILLLCCYLLGSFWVLPKLVSMFRRL